MEMKSSCFSFSSFSIFSFFLISFLVCLSPVSGNLEGEKGGDHGKLDDSLIKWWHHIPRFSYVPHKDVTNHFHPTSENYWMGISSTSFIPIFFALFSPILMVSLCCMIRCRNMERTKCERFSTTIFLIFLCLVSAAGLYMALIFHQTSSSSFDIVEDFTDDLLKNAKKIENTIQSINISNHILSDISNTTELTIKNTEHTSDYIDDISSYEPYVVLVFLILISLVIIVVFLGSITTICEWKHGISISLVIGIFIAPLLMVSAGLTIPAAVTNSDICSNSSNAIRSVSSLPETLQWIDFYLDCKEPSPWTNIIASVEDELEKAKQELNVSIAHNKTENVKELEILIKDIEYLLQDLDSINSCHKTEKYWEDFTGKLCGNMIFSLTGLSLVFIVSTILLYPLIIYGSKRKDDGYIPLDEWDEF